jgi:hypothetical protein
MVIRKRKSRDFEDTKWLSEGRKSRDFEDTKWLSEDRK